MTRHGRPWLELHLGVLRQRLPLNWNCVYWQFTSASFFSSVLSSAAVEETDVGCSAGLPVNTVPPSCMETEIGTAKARVLKEATVTAASKLPANLTDGDIAAVTMTTDIELRSDADQKET